MNNTANSNPGYNRRDFNTTLGMRGGLLHRGDVLPAGDKGKMLEEIEEHCDGKQS